MKDARATRWLTRSDGLATRLREARGRRSGADLAGALGWASSKVTRIELGTQVPSADDVTAWARETGLSASDTAQLHLLLEEFRSMRTTFRQRVTAGQVGIQQGYNDLTAGSTLVRHFQTAWVPGILQVAGYTESVLEQMAALHQQDEGDIQAAVGKRMQRQQLLYDVTRRFEFILAEPVLRWLFTDVTVMRAQLDRLQSVGGMDLLWRDAIEGNDARRLILDAIDALPFD